MNQANILIVEDDAALREALGETVNLAGHRACLAENGKVAMTLLETNQVDIIVSDVQMNEMDGNELLKKVQQNYPNIRVILITAHANIDDAVSAMRNGAIDYLTKPFEPELLMEKIHRYLPTSTDGLENPIAEDSKSKKLLNLALRVAKTNATVLISGESGTGKEVLARFIHDHSERRGKAFIAINCAAIPENMLEATLFVYEKGAFTGAVKPMPGKFEQAQGGTLLLDEISEMDLSLQAKILRVLQENEVERLGSRKMIALDVRVLATTNQDLKAEVSRSRFREDLYYRLNVFPLHWIPIRERPEDILPLANYLLEKHLSGSGSAIPEFSEEALNALKTYHWPGNAREMDNVIQRALILKTGDIIEAEDLKIDFSDKETSANKESLGADLKDHEFQPIIEALHNFTGNRGEVAKSLGISERTLRYKLARMRDVGIEDEYLA